jgi:hypothetical protein
MTRLRAAEIEAADTAVDEGKIEVRMADRFLEGWLWVSRNTGLPRQDTACTLGRLSKPTEPEAAPAARARVLDLDDQQFLAIDRAVGRLPRALRRMVFVEYGWAAPQRAKARELRLTHLDYRQRLNAAQWAVYAALTPHIDRWWHELGLPE